MKFRMLLVIVTLCILAGCRVQITVPTGGVVTTPDFSFLCRAVQRCELDIINDGNQVALVAVPRPGYKFLHWKGEERHLCPDFTDDTCVLGGPGPDEDKPMVDDFMASDHLFLLEPVFEQTEELTTETWYGLDESLGVSEDVLQALTE